MGVRIVAYAEDRARLLAHGEMAMNIYSGRDTDEVTRDTYRDMCEAADLMGLMLSEPILEVGPADCWGGRYITTRAGVFDKPGS
jgi:hypothetical protein